VRRVASLVVIISVVLSAPAFAQVEKTGDNRARIVQRGSVRSGNAIAGSQITGLVQSGGRTRITKTNVSKDSKAVSGQASVDSIFGWTPGAVAEALQLGDSTLGVRQRLDATSGDAIAGSQLTGLAVSGIADITEVNTAEDAEAISGDADADSILASIVDGIDPVPSAQEGDDDFDFSLRASAVSGNAVAGSQVVGGAITGIAELVAINESSGAQAVSGDASSSTSATAFNQPPVFLPGIDLPALQLPGIVQEGDTRFRASQSADTRTGDATAGSQVIGLLGGGVLLARIDNGSDDDDSESGGAEASEVLLFFGPPFGF
jgi:hypothetical protein